MVFFKRRCFVNIVVDPRFKLAPFDTEWMHHRAMVATVALMERAHESTLHENDATATSDSADPTSVPPSSVGISSPTLQTLASVASTLSGSDIPATSDPSSRVLTSSNVPTLHLIQEQLTTYTLESNIPQSECPLLWWAANHETYPQIANVATRLLAIPATATSTKHLFTKEGKSLMDKRNAVSRDKAEQVLLIMENL